MFPCCVTPFAYSIIPLYSQTSLRTLGVCLEYYTNKKQTNVLDFSLSCEDEKNCFRPGLGLKVLVQSAQNIFIRKAKNIGKENRSVHVGSER